MTSPILFPMIPCAWKKADQMKLLRGLFQDMNDKQYNSDFLRSRR